MSIASEDLSCAAVLLSKNGADADAIERVICRLRGQQSPTTLSSRYMTPRCRRVVEGSHRVAQKYASAKIGTEHILLAILEERECVGAKLLACVEGCDVTALKDELITFLRTNAVCLSAARTSPTGLLKYGHDLTQRAREGGLDAVIGREAETERLIRVLCRRTKNNPCLIGEAGVGKTAIVEGLAQRIVRGEVPPFLRSATVVSLDMSALVAGTKYRGDFEERIRSVVDEAVRMTNLFLFIDEIHTIVGAGAAEGAIDAANILKPPLARGSLHLIGATTQKEYRSSIERDAALERRFQAIEVEEPTQDVCVSMLRGLRPVYEQHHGVRISDEALTACVRLSVRHMPERYLPDKALDLLDETCSCMHLKTSCFLGKTLKREEKARQTLRMSKTGEVGDCDADVLSWVRADASLVDDEQRPVVTEANVRRVLSTLSGEPSGVDETPESCWRELPTRLSRRVVGQQEAIRALCNALFCAQAGLADPTRPLGVFLFLGESGVGKTELAKALAEEWIGTSSALIRYDMSEFSEAHSIAKLIGSPPGYVGYGEGGSLTEHIRRHPRSVLLFDEIEKAHADVRSLLLQVNGEGLLTDACGRRVSFCHTCIIYTSNVGADLRHLPSHIGFSPSSRSISSTREELFDHLRGQFSAEWLGRIDEFILFSSLGEEALCEIARSHMEQTRRRLLEMGIELSFDTSIPMHLARSVGSRGQGARPLIYLVREQIECPLAQMVLKKILCTGDRVSLHETEGNLAFFKEDGQRVCMDGVEVCMRV